MKKSKQQSLETLLCTVNAVPRPKELELRKKKVENYI